MTVKTSFELQQNIFFLRNVGGFQENFHVAIKANTIISLIALECQAYFATLHMQCVNTQTYKE